MNHLLGFELSPVNFKNILDAQNHKTIHIRIEPAGADFRRTKMYTRIWIALKEKIDENSLIA